jgi:hypothetical protein
VVPVLLVALLSAGAWAALRRGSEPLPRPALSGPNCLHIQGEELAVNDRWRVVHTGDGGKFGTDYSPTPVVACDVRVPGPARVRLLGTVKLTGGGEEYEAQGGPYLQGGGIGGDLVLIETRFYEQLRDGRVDQETGFTTLYDLRRGASLRLPGNWLKRYRGSRNGFITDTDHALHSRLTTGGGLVTAYSTQDGRKAPVRFGPITTWDAGGRRTLPERIDRIANARARRGDDGGLYFRTTGGAARRVALHGAATTGELRVDPTLAWRRMELKREPSEEPEPPESEQIGSTYSGLPADRDGNGGGFDITDSLWLRYFPSDRARNRTVRITADGGGGPSLARLAKGSDDELQTLGSDGDIAIILARFREQPGVRRVRMVGQYASPAAQAFFDLPGTTAFRRRGRALIGEGVYGLTDGARIWLWGPSGGHVYAAPGTDDLTLAVGGDGLFATDAGGRARYFAA